MPGKGIGEIDLLCKTRVSTAQLQRKYLGLHKKLGYISLATITRSNNHINLWQDT